MPTLPPVLLELQAKAGEALATLGEADKAMAKLGTEGSAHLAKVSAVGKAALFGLGGAAVVAGGFSLEMADKFETAHAKLEQSFHNVGATTDQYTKQLGAQERQLESYGFTNAQVQEAVANMTTALGSPKKALDQVGIAADLARYKHISLADAATTVARAEQGQLRPLKQLGIDLPVAAGGALKLQQAHTALSAATAHYTELLNADHQKHALTLQDHVALAAAKAKVQAAQEKVNQVSATGATIMAALSQRIGGQASAASATFAGKQAALKAQLEDLGAKIGTALIPYIETLIADTVTVIHWFEQHQTTAEALAGVIGTVLVGAISVYIAKQVEAGAKAVVSFAKMIASGAAWVATMVTGSAAVVTAEEGVAVTSEATGAATTAAFGPIGIALVALGVAAYELYKHWDTIWSGIKAVVSAAYDWIRGHALLIAAAFLPVAVGIYELYKHWNTVWTDMKKVAGDFVGFVIQDVIKPVIDAFLTFAGDMIDGAAKAFGWVPGIGGKLKSAAKAFDQFHHDTDATLQGWANDMYGLGESGAEGFANGITQKQKDAINAAAKMGQLSYQAAKNAIRSASPSKLFRELGNTVPQGFAAGIDDGTGEVVTAAAKMAQAAAGAVQQALSNKVLAGIADSLKPGPTSAADLAGAYAPARTAAMSAQATAGVRDAHVTELAEHYDELAKKLATLQAADKAAYSAAQRHAQALADQARAALRVADAMPAATKAERAARNAAIDHAHALQDQAHAATEAAAASKAKADAVVAAERKQVDAAKAALDAAKSSAQAAQQAADQAAQNAQQAAQALVSQVKSDVEALAQTVKSFTSSLQQGLTGDDSIASLWNQLTQAGDASVASLQTNMDSILASAQKFAGDLTSLIAEGANQTLIQQVDSLGPQAGDALAQQLLAAGPAAVTALQTSMGQIADFSLGAAQSMAQSFYGPGVTAMQQFIAGLESQFPELTAALQPLLAEINGLFGAGNLQAPTSLPTRSGTVASLYAVTPQSVAAAALPTPATPGLQPVTSTKVTATIAPTVAVTVQGNLDQVTLDQVQQVATTAAKQAAATATASLASEITAGRSV